MTAQSQDQSFDDVTTVQEATVELVTAAAAVFDDVAPAGANDAALEVQIAAAANDDALEAQIAAAAIDAALEVQSAAAAAAIDVALEAQTAAAAAAAAGAEVSKDVQDLAWAD